MVPTAKTDQRSERPETRRTLAILFGDVARSTFFKAIVGDLDVATALKELFARLAALELLHRGRVAKNFGDGFMAVFEEPLAALRFAVALLHSLQEKPILIAENRLELCLSLHCGEVSQVTTSYGEEFLGSPINLAARLNAVAPPSEIVMSESFYRALPPEQQSPARLEVVQIKGFGAVPIFHHDSSKSTK
jgi:adenylate cyclase